MTVRGGAARYAAVLRQKPVARPFAAAGVARLSVAMAPLGILLLVCSERGTYAFAGLVAGAFAVGTAVGGPWWGARVDRLGQTRVVLTTSLSSAALLVAVAVLAVDGGPSELLVAAAGLAGACFPPLSPAMRATWVTALADPALRPAAFALDAVAMESSFVLGPLLIALLLGVGQSVPLLVTALLLGCGGAVYSLQPAVRRQAPRDRPVAPAVERRWMLGAGSVLGAGGVPALLVVTTALSVGFGQVDTSMAATARQVLGDPGRVGLLFTAIAGGSTVGGLVYGTVRVSVGEHLRLRTLLGLFAAGLAPLAVLMGLTRPSLWVLLPLLFLCGLFVAPSLIITQNLIGHLTSAAQVSEAQAWLSTAGTAGSAAGTAVSGVVIDRFGIGWSFAAASAAVATGSVVAGLHRERWTGHRRERSPSGQR